MDLLEYVRNINAMKILYATTNPAKFESVRSCFARQLPEVELLSLQDVEPNGKTAPEPGNSPKENSLVKARCYFDWYHMPCIAVDCGLFFEEVAEEENPGVFVRRVNDKYLDDEEMRTHYGELARRYGGRITGRWITAMTLIAGDGTAHTIMNENTASDPFWLDVSVMRPIEEPGFPMDSFSVDVKTGKHYYDIDWAAETMKNVDDAFAGFVRKQLFDNPQASERVNAGDAL